MKILIKTVAGSHLFGTNTEESDKDYKGVFLPDARDILLCNNVQGLNESTGSNDEKNGKDDIDIELYSLKKFLKMIQNGDTAALELLFTPESMILEKDPLWDEVLKHKDKLLSSKVTGIIGYSRQQANKYGIKGSRMGELNNIIEFLKKLEKNFSFPDPKLKHAWLDVQDEIKKYDHIDEISLKVKSENQTEIPAIEILGKKFDHHCNLAYVIGVLKKIYKNYGQRAREAKNNNGIDWKALSHAVRVMYQGIELLENSKITLPLQYPYVNTVRDIKQGKLDYKIVSEKIEYLLGRLEKLKDSSSLQEKVSQSVVNDLILKLHMKQLEGFEL